MATLIKFGDNPGGGEFLNKWFHNRTVRSNKNVILPFTGPTGSGKTYNALSAGEAWYKFRFNEPFPIDHVSFSLGALMEKILELHKSGKIRKGEYFILEEAGANFGSLDFQSKISKMFSYILQSFRSMNLILILTVPVLTMINKQARQLVHGHFITSGIDFEKNQGKVKPFFHQINEKSGKSYWKYPRARIRGKVRKIERLRFDLPSQNLITKYESKKQAFVVDLGEKFVEEYRKKAIETTIRESRKELTPVEQRVFNLLIEGMNQIEIAQQLGVSQPNISETVKRIRKRGYNIENSIGNKGYKPHNLILAPN